ncbi:RecQ family ATP-dependent DNA helicase [Dactylosporangium sp. NPDC006015]|uniref:RecQ family ATP-dependent DNA helicase n=1 Tax=Dactylosporangium sp. NPDC006015 TaxID=3154576 RepID=UPI0033BD9B67
MLPPNLGLARDLLTQRGPLSPEDLAAALRDSGIVLGPPRLAGLPERFPDAFGRDDMGRLIIPTLRVAPEPPTPPDVPTEAEGDGMPAWLTVAAAPPIAVSDLVVLAAGPLRNEHETVRDFAVIRLDDTSSACLPGDGDQAGPLRKLAEGASAAVGFGLSDLPTSPYAALTAALPSALIDLRLLALLHEPARPASRLSDLCATLGVTYGDGLLDQAQAAAECLRALLAKVDPADASWRLARACLVAGGLDLARVLPDVPLPQGATDGLSCATDPLLTPPAVSSAPSGARDAVRQVLAHLDKLGFTARRSQEEMARAIAEVLDDQGLLAIEAPTGTGKSLAYLAPAAGRAARAARPVVVATATKVLQQQLRRDVARMQQQGMFAAPFRQLFGVANYLCTREVAVNLEASEAAAGADHWLALAVAVRALATSEAGIWDDVADADVASTRADYRATREALRTDAPSCERFDCAWAAQCPLMTRLAGVRERPGVVAVNHALIATWAKLAQQGHRPGDLLSPAGADLVFDEAHDLEDSLTAAWTEAVGSPQLHGLAARLDGRTGLDRHVRRLARAGVQLPGGRNLRALASQLRRETDELTAAVTGYLHEYGGTGRSTVLRLGVVRSRPEYRQLAEAVRKFGDCLYGVKHEVDAVESAVRALAPNGARQRMLARVTTIRTGATARAVREAGEILARLRSLPDEHLWVYLLSGVDDLTDWTFSCIPIEVGSAFAGGIVRAARSVTLTSATLTAGGTFEYLGTRLGITVEPGALDPAVFEGRQLSSPFDHERQSAVVLTNHLPAPVPTQEQEFIEEFARDQVGLLSLTGGRALTLFAARRRMEAVADLVRDRRDALEQRGVSLMVQGEAGSAEIAERFRRDLGTVVYGVRSYWQGFDAPGETLSYLVIEKPPYPHPDDPVVAARVRAIADRGGDPFLEYVVPKTAILLAQGFGRLIRGEADRGVALIADRRMQSPGTANRMLLETLPGPQVYHAQDRDDAWRFAVRFVTGEEPDLAEALALAGNDVDAALAELRLHEGEDPEAKLREAARRLFGIEELHDEQLRLMTAQLGGADTVGILPTGMGKSLCFQLPALLRPQDRATVVVSPLVALIKDQLDDLRGRRGLRGVQGITQSTPSTVRTEIVRDLAAGKVRLLYVSPERLVRDPVLRIALERQDLAALVVDEAHCVSDWGHDFRPEFRRVSTAVAHLGRAPRMALTATATPLVAQDIGQTLELDRPVTVSRPADRPNLRFRVVKVTGERDRARELLRVVTAMDGVPGVVYASRRAVTEEVAALLRRAGVRARHYHAGMVPEQREAVQDDFLAGTTQVIVATKAFGMGVNKPDIGWVVHYDLPDSLDAYVQESGRAARSPQLTGECVLLYSVGDIARRRSHLADTGEARRLAQVTMLLGLLPRQQHRCGDVVFDQEELADAVGVEPDELNVLLAWLERTGALEQRPDCSARGTVHVGLREPEDMAARRRFRELSVLLKLRPQVASRIDFDALRDAHGIDPDDLERDLVDWSLDRLVTFASSRRYRRVRLLSERVDARMLSREVDRWSQWQRAQLQALLSYVESGTCRRSTMVEYFGFPSYRCGPGHEVCDNCGGVSAGRDLPASAVPDPEHLVNAELTVLQAVAWASALPVGRYGESGLKAAVLGAETIAGRPLGAGLQRCPQFGALRYLRAAERRWDTAVSALLEGGLIDREKAQRDERTYTTLSITVEGRKRLGGGVG